MQEGATAADLDLDGLKPSFLIEPKAPEAESSPTVAEETAAPKDELKQEVPPEQPLQTPQEVEAKKGTLKEAGAEGEAKKDKSKRTHAVNEELMLAFRYFDKNGRKSLLCRQIQVLMISSASPVKMIKETHS